MGGELELRPVSYLSDDSQSVDKLTVGCAAYVHGIEQPLVEYHVWIPVLVHVTRWLVVVNVPCSKPPASSSRFVVARVYLLRPSEQVTDRRTRKLTLEIQTLE
jgi:hypothetical protein